MTERSSAGAFASLRRQLGAALIDGFFTAISDAARPFFPPEAEVGLEVQRDVPYLPTGLPEHTLDVYRPKGPPGPRRPVVLYLHGGGFRILSKDTHWLFARRYAEQGYLVVNANYRLSPQHPFPGGLTDAAAALQWLCDHADELGADLGRLVLAGESAGANLALSLTLATCSRRPEPFAAELFDRGVVPRAVVAACGLFEVSRPERFTQASRFVRDRVEEVSRAYLGGAHLEGPRALELADPLVALEQGAALARPLPSFFLPCGTWDVLLDDTHRLARALERSGHKSTEAREYLRGPHAFHAFVFTRAARACWRDTFDFLARAGVAPR